MAGWALNRGLCRVAGWTLNRGLCRMAGWTLNRGLCRMAGRALNRGLCRMTRWTLNSRCTYHGEQVDDDVGVSTQCQECPATQVLVHLKGVALLCDERKWPIVVLCLAVAGSQPDL